MKTKPMIGTIATVYSVTDCYPGVVEAVSRTGYQITIREVDAIVISGSQQDGSAQYRYQRFAAKSQGRTWKATRRSDGIYRVMGNKVGSGGVSLGTQRRYYDPHF